MKRLLTVILGLLLASMLSAQEPAPKRDVLVKKWFKNYNTYIIRCKGYPKEGTGGIARTGSAKEAALLNAQVLAREIFTDAVDVIKSGRIVEYKLQKDYVIITYEVKKKGLKKYLRKKG